MIKRWRSAAAILLLAGAPLGAAEYSEVVPLELLQPLLGPARALQGLPPGFPLPSLPPGLTVIGSIEHLAGGQMVLLHSQQDAAEAAGLLRDRLLAAGWRAARTPSYVTPLPDPAPWVAERPPVFPPSLGIRGLPAVETGLDRSVPEVGIRGIPTSGGGLVSRDPFTPIPADMGASAWVRDVGVIGLYPGQSQNEIGLCGDAGLLLLSAAANQVYLQLRSLGQFDPSLCTPTADPQPPVSPPPNLLDYLPELQAGERLSTLPQFPPRRGLASFGGREFNTYWYSGLDNARALDIDVEYALQLLAQGWEQDAEWSSPDAAGSNWIRVSEQGLRLYLSLVVEELSEDIFLTEITLRILP